MQTTRRREGCRTVLGLLSFREGDKEALAPPPLSLGDVTIDLDPGQYLYKQINIKKDGRTFPSCPNSSDGNLMVDLCLLSCYSSFVIQKRGNPIYNLQVTSVKNRELPALNMIPTRSNYSYLRNSSSSLPTRGKPNSDRVPHSIMLRYLHCFVALSFGSGQMATTSKRAFILVIFVNFKHSCCAH